MSLPAAIPKASPIDSTRYRVTDTLGRGSWGVVYQARDTRLGTDVAIKVLDPSDLARAQMQARGVNLEDAVLKEASHELVPSRHVIPRKLEWDESGQALIIMPIYPAFLDTHLGEYDFRSHLNRGLDQPKILHYLSDIAQGLADIHAKKRAHGDLALKNIAIDTHGNALIGDLGSSTVFAQQHDGKRDNVGSMHVRSPENFSQDSAPTQRSDVWSFGALAYRLCTGKYPLEDEFDNAKDPVKLIADMEPSALESILDAKIKKNIPKTLRPLVRSCLTTKEHKRLQSGEDIVEALERVSRGGIYRAMTAKASTYAKAAAGIGIFSAMLGAGLAYDSTPIHEPLMHTQEIVPAAFEQPITVEREDLVDLPEVLVGGMFGAESMSAFHGERFPERLAYFTGKYLAALRIEPLTQYQEALFSRQTHPTITAALAAGPKHTFPLDPNGTLIVSGNSIAIALDKYQRKDRFDLEDFCVEAHLGPTVLAQAKRWGGEDFAQYVKATSPDGYRVILPNEEMFLKTWIAQFH